MENVFNVLNERGFIAQTTHQNEIIELLNKEKITFYIGIDPTADSLHIGHFLTLMAISHMANYGHKPICLVGGGTAMIGDPTDRTDMRPIMTKEVIQGNVNNIKSQISNFIDFDDDKAILVDNADWLLKLNYLDFLKNYGIHFSVNKMLTADAYRSRFEKGLSFFEFNYMLMQSYDFLELYRKHNCKLQFGGNDQWSNILGGINLIKKCENAQTFGMTFNLLTTSDGNKMGKSMGGALWLDKNKTSPFDFYQYFRNVDDADVIKFLKLLTFLPLEEITELAKLEGREINKAKEILAFEVTKIIHGEEEAKKSSEGAKFLFSGGNSLGSAPTTSFEKNKFESGVSLIDLLLELKLAPSKSEARRLITQGGVKINEVQIKDFKYLVSLNDFKNDTLLIQKGKKAFHQVNII